VSIKVKVKVAQLHACAGTRIAPTCLQHGTGRRWVVSTTPAPFYFREIPGTHYTERWVGLRACVDGAGNLTPYWNSIPGPSIM
jgi:hypothetical protein